MTSTISALTTGGGGIVMSGDSSGNLSLLSGATTVVAVTATGASVTGTLAVSGGVTLTTTLPVLQGGTGVTTSTGTGAGVHSVGPSISSAVMTTMASSVLTFGTAVGASGTSVDFTSIPSFANRITLNIVGLSTNGTSNPMVQIGTGGTPTYTTSGYTGAAFECLSNVTPLIINDSAGFILTGDTRATDSRTGTVILTRRSSATNIWIAVSNLGNTAAARISISMGSVSLGAALTAIRLTTVNGTDTFDAGSVDILYE